MTGHHSAESSRSATIAHLVERLSNTDIRWGGTYIGLVPTIVGDEARQLLTIGSDAIPLLINALTNESKFVVSHVLLTLLSGVEYHTVPWNCLNLELSSRGKISIDANQRFELARRWRAWQQITPRPHSLPP